MVKNFIQKEYQLYSSKISMSGKPPVMVMLSDLHNHSFGTDNSHLLREIELLQPDGILIGGDMIIGKSGYSVDTACTLIRRISSVAPVFHAMGNHEYRMKYHPEGMTPEYREYEQVLREENVTLLDNAVASVTLQGTKFSIYGLSLPQACYKKFRYQHADCSDIQQLIGQADASSYQILMAHNPRFALSYFEWGADLTVSGHYHGGMLRLGKRGVISPYFTLFPPYSYGRFEQDGKIMLVSAGMGEHTIPLRLFNPRELLVLRFYPLEEK